MRMFSIRLLIFLWISTDLVNAFSPGILILGGVAALLGKKLHTYLSNYETCRDKWIEYNLAGLESDMERKLLGQHLASQLIMKAVTGLVNTKNPKKPLVLSLHGSTGTGKTFMSQLIAKNIYRKGLASRHVHQFVATVHFPHMRLINTYKTQLRQWIRGNVTNCPRSLFIFDEMDQMHPELIEGIKPYLGYTENLDGVSYRQAVFIFLSNAGSENIMRVALDFRREGRDREEIQLKDLEPAFFLEVFDNQKNGSWHHSLIENKLVDFFVPFLPLEHNHVRMCALAEMRAQDLTPNLKIATAVADEMTYFPQEEKLFSVKGCKTVQSRLLYYYY
ncbi:hypothetical protein GJAV_G00194880 [Gymnothorax javanicus]|nr:hypothetical protein GJAV_G00194880 [Gymnothorax javanicus]